MNFDEASHKYTDSSGNEIPSVTTLIRQSGFADLSWFDDSARRRGSVVHVATSLYDKGQLPDETNIPADCLPYFEAWKLFREQAKPKIEHIEMPVESLVWNFAGTLDRLVCFDGGPYTLVEIKTGSPAPWHCIQTAGYQIAVEESVAPCPHRCVVYLRDDGSFKMIEHDSPEDADVFRSLAIVAQWKEKNL